MTSPILSHRDLIRSTVYADAVRAHERHDMNHAVIDCPRCHEALGRRAALYLGCDYRTAAAMRTAWYREFVGVSVCPAWRAEEIKLATLKVCAEATGEIAEAPEPHVEKVMTLGELLSGVWLAVACIGVIGLMILLSLTGGR